MKITGKSLSEKTFYYSGDNADELKLLVVPTVGSGTWTLDGACKFETENPQDVQWILNYNHTKGRSKSFSITKNGKYPYHHLVK